MKYYPIFLNLEGRPCLIVGGGKVAFVKVRKMIDCGATVRVVSPEFVPDFDNLDQIEKRQKPFDKTDLEGIQLAIATTGDSSVNRILAEACQERGVFYCLADEPESGDFIIPSSAEKGDVQFAITTSGSAPALAKRLRQDIEQSFSDNIADYVKFLNQVRQEVRKHVNDPSRRRVIAEQLASQEGYNRYCQLTERQQLDWIEQIIAGEISS